MPLLNCKTLENLPHFLNLYDLKCSILLQTWSAYIYGDYGDCQSLFIMEIVSNQ